MLNKNILVFGLVVAFSGCATLKDMPKNIYGNSIRSLEMQRDQAVAANFKLTYNECFDEILAIAKKNKYTVFSKDVEHGVIVIMKVPSVVDTTEVGVFLAWDLGNKNVRVEVSSRSSLGKKIVAQTIFEGLTSVVNRT